MKTSAPGRRSTIHVYLRLVVDEAAVDRQATRRRVNRSVVVQELARLVECRAADSVAFVDGVERIEATAGPVVLRLAQSEIAEL